MNKEQAEIIDYILKKGDRVELIPVKDGIKIMQVKRHEVKPNKKKSLFESGERKTESG